MDERAWYVEFEVHDDERFAKLATVFDALRAAKKIDVDDPAWQALFDDKALAHFWWPTEEEAQEWQQKWFATPLEKRCTDPSLVKPWDFDSLIEAFADADMELFELRRLPDGRGRLEFEPMAHPYGGTGCLEALVAAFEHRVTEVKAP